MDRDGHPLGHKDFKNITRLSPPGPRAFILSNELGLGRSPNRAPNKCNLSKAEKETRQSLKRNTNIIIKTTDKGSAVVIMNLIMIMRRLYFLSSTTKISKQAATVQTISDL